MQRDGYAYGVTTYQLATAGASFAQLTTETNVLRTIITGFTGSSLYISGMSMVGSSMAVAGAAIQPANLPLEIWGPAPLYFYSGATTVVSIIRELSQDPEGQQQGGITITTGHY